LFYLLFIIAPSAALFLASRSALIVPERRERASLNRTTGKCSSTINLSRILRSSNLFHVLGRRPGSSLIVEDTKFRHAPWVSNIAGAGVLCGLPYQFVQVEFSAATGLGGAVDRAGSFDRSFLVEAV
jgi:hypothetical protein